MSFAFTVNRPALVTAAVSDRLPVSTSPAAVAMVTGPLAEVPLKVSVPLLTLRKPPPTLPLMATAPATVVFANKLPVTDPPLRVAPLVAVSAAVPARAPAPFWVYVLIVSAPFTVSVPVLVTFIGSARLLPASVTVPF